MSFHFQPCLDPSAVKWAEIWNKVGIAVVGDRLGQQALNLAAYHLFATGTVHNDGGIGPRGLTGETYRGHEFWDDILYYPVISLQHPQNHPIASGTSLPWTCSGQKSGPGK
jgi:trehalose/maltose hydrolase-like predicted phosphorylase